MRNVSSRPLRAVYRYDRLNIYEKDLSEPISEPEPLIEVTWREGNALDIERLNAAEHNYDELRKSYAREALREGAVFLLAEHEGSIVHLCWISYRRIVLPGLHIPLHPSRAYFYDARTPETFRNKRLHDAGIRRRLAKAKADGKSFAISLVDVDNPASRKNMEREGFQLLGTVTMTRLFRKYRVVRLSPEVRAHISSQERPAALV